VIDRDEIERVITAGLSRRRTPAQIANAIVTLLEDPAWARAFSHPTRSAILRLLRAHSELSPSRALEELDEPLGTISYHFRQLAKLGLIEVCDQIPRRGSIKHVYRLIR
jgi:DNA-binding transcriptional ArsR family regulator